MIERSIYGAPFWTRLELADVGTVATVLVKDGRKFREPTAEELAEYERRRRNG